MYFESFTISIFFSEDKLDQKSFIIKHLEFLRQIKREKSPEINHNLSQELSSRLSSSIQEQSIPILPYSLTTEHILHTFDTNLIPYGSIINRNHVLIGPVRLYFTTTDLYIASINCNRKNLKITIANQCPSHDQAILCIPYFTIKNYGNRSNIFLIELGKSTYGNGEIHMKCQSSSLASTIHLLVSPVIEERPLALSSAFQNQLLTTKRIEKSKNIHPPIQLNNDTTTNQSILNSPLSLIKRKAMETPHSNSSTAVTKTKSHSIGSFFRTLARNASNLKRSTTFQSDQNKEQFDNRIVLENKSIGFNMSEKSISNDQHQITLPESQKATDSTLSVSSLLTKKTTETVLTSTSTINTNKQETTTGTYIDMGLTIQKAHQNQEQKIEDEIIIKETTPTADVGVNSKSKKRN